MRAACFIVVRMFSPVSVDETISSLPIDHRKTLGWLRWHRIMFSNWERPCGFDDSIRVSASTSMPSSSQASSSSGVGGLCEVRSALHPISCSFLTR